MKVLNWIKNPTTKLKFAKYVLRLSDFVEDWGTAMSLFSLILATALFFMMVVVEITFKSYVLRFVRYEIIMVFLLYIIWELRNFWEWISSSSYDYVKQYGKN